MILSGLSLGMSEGDLQQAVIDLAVMLGFRVYHVTNVHKRLRSHTSPGFPDLVIANERVTLYRELKREGKDPTPDQQEWLDILAASGNDVGVWRPSDYLNDTIYDTLLYWSGRT